MTSFTEKVYTSKGIRDFNVEQFKKIIYETGCTGCVEPRHIIYKINEQYHNNMGTYRCPAEMTSSGQDMSYWAIERKRAFESYKQEALRNIIPHWIRIISNCKKLLISDKYDMFEEFKRVHPQFSGYFDCKEFSWDIIGDSHHTNITTFIDCVITCLLSKETENKQLHKQNEKIRKQQELQNKQLEEQLKREFECEKLWVELDKHKLQTVEMFIEYKKVDKIKSDTVPGIVNFKLIDYFTEDKKKYIQQLLEQVKRKQVSYTSISTQTQELDIPQSTNHIIRKNDTIFDSKHNENIIIHISECNDGNSSEYYPMNTQQIDKHLDNKKRGRPRKPVKENH